MSGGTFPNGNVQQPPRYENVQEIGKGAYSAVYKGRDRLTEGRYVAMKEVRIPLNAEEGIPMTTVREIGLLRQLDKFEHPNVVRYYNGPMHLYRERTNYLKFYPVVNFSQIFFYQKHKVWAKNTKFHILCKLWAKLNFWAPRFFLSEICRCLLQLLGFSNS